MRFIDDKFGKMLNTSTPESGKTVEVQPAKIVKKTPKFPSRERHLAIRRKKCPPTVKEGEPNSGLTRTVSCNECHFE